MDDLTIFTEKGLIPTDQDLIENLGTTYALWHQIQGIVLDQYPKGLKEWNYPGKKEKNMDIVIELKIKREQYFIFYQEKITSKLPLFTGKKQQI